MYNYFVINQNIIFLEAFTFAFKLIDSYFALSAKKKISNFIFKYAEGPQNALLRWVSSLVSCSVLVI